MSGWRFKWGTIALCNEIHRWSGRAHFGHVCILLVSAGSDGFCSGAIRQCENRRPHQPCGLSACWSLVGRRWLDVWGKGVNSQLAPTGYQSSGNLKPPLQSVTISQWCPWLPFYLAVRLTLSIEVTPTGGKEKSATMVQWWTDALLPVTKWKTNNGQTTILTCSGPPGSLGRPPTASRLEVSLE